MRTLRILTLISGCYLAGWVTVDLLVPVMLANRAEENGPVARRAEPVRDTLVLREELVVP